MAESPTCMEILALAIWLLLGGLATILAPFGITNPGAGIAALATFTGVAASVVFLVSGAPIWAAWVQFGMAVLAILGCTLASAWWLGDETHTTGSEFEGLAAMALGGALPFYATVVFVTGLMAFQVTDPVI
jgi:hypothetical protein